MDVYRDGYEYRVQDYAGLVFTRQAEGTLRSGLDAAVALLASGVTLTNRWHSPQGQPREGWSDAGACVNVHAP